MNELERVAADELTDAMASVDVLGTFLRLPQEDQQRFWRWVGQARNEESYWRRVNALVLALRIGPLYPDRSQRRREPLPDEQP